MKTAALMIAMAALSAADLPFPADYREWIYLSSGLGMSYRAGESSDDPSFDNVFAARSAYASFLRNGIWPNGTVLVLEARSSRSHGSINQAGRFQDAIQDVEAEVKDQSGVWTFYSFGDKTTPGKAFPRTAACYSCHAQNAAVDNTFVQFYPTLLAIAKQKGTLRPSR
jgi:hypothetical protein